MPIIEIRNIGKKYNISHQRGGYLTLRDVITNIFRNPFGFLKKKAKVIIGRSRTEEFWALDDVSFDVEKGDVIGIIGHNGAGKSTLLKILSQITPPTTGEIKINGRVGSLLEVGTGFHPELTGRENIFLNGAILGMKRDDIVKKFDEIVEFSGVQKFLDTPVKYYSSGMYVRLAFSVAAHMEPDVLIIDEVLAVGDAEFQKKCLGKMDDITRKEGRTILFVSHNLAAIQNLCKKCILLENGKIKFFGDTDQAIFEYTKKGLVNEPFKKIKPENHIRGTYEAKIKNVKISNGSGSLAGSFLINEKISFEVDYLVTEKSRELSFWVLFSDQNGLVVLNSLQKDSRELIRPVVGEQKIKIDFDNLGLMPGVYMIAIGIFAHNTINSFEFADWVEPAQSLQIEPSFMDGSEFDGRMGMVNKTASWTQITQ
jgi:lipopolysaccharide transport system ATP-binding protein